MRKTKIILILFLLIITGCSPQNNNKKEYKYEGKNSNWQVQFTESLNGIKDERALTFTYKGDLSDLKAHKNLKYSYKTNTNHGSGDIDLGDSVNTKTFEHKVSGEGQSTNIIESDSVTVNISLDENSETIDLKIVTF
ncbi:hypothetical protein [Clostridium sp. HBUAS56017]|uniref:hypothetical protein n=1 Tax=Clostridium sp. HBUAS56017 TaxID=2571128 RepID=UPI001178C3A8|nr:hypothetical protein [Clostridium sp. HBUAS56017]